MFEQQSQQRRRVEIILDARPTGQDCLIVPMSPVPHWFSLAVLRLASSAVARGKFDAAVINGGSARERSWERWLRGPARGGIRGHQPAVIGGLR